MASSDIPFGSEFSLNAIKFDLPTLLGMVLENVPNRKALQAAIDQHFFSHHHHNNPRKTGGDNTVLSMQAYGIITLNPDSYQLTELGTKMVALKDQSDELYKVFGQHVLLECKGLTLVECIRDLMVSRKQLTKFTIANELRTRGLHYPENGKHLNVLRQWLELFGVLNTKHERSTLWEPSEEGIQKLMGMSTSDLDILAELTPEQRDFARALALLNKDNIPSNQVRDHAVTLYGTIFSEGGLPQSILHKLQDVGLITWTKTTEGRGAKPHLVSPTDKLRNDLLFPAMEAVKTAVGANYKKLIRMSLEDILHDLDSDNTGIKGIALEALSFYLTRLLDLTFVKWRYRSNQTGGTEVDVVVEGARLIYSRWQIQCKNTKDAHVDQVAKEVGIATAMRTNVVMFVCTGKIGSSVTRFAQTVMENTAMQVILLDKSDLEQIRVNPTNITVILNEQARQAMAIKRIQLEDKH